MCALWMCGGKLECDWGYKTSIDLYLVVVVGAALTTIAVSYVGVWRFFFFQAEDGIRDYKVTGVQTCALPIYQGRGGISRLSELTGMSRTTITKAVAELNSRKK